MKGTIPVSLAVWLLVSACTSGPAKIEKLKKPDYLLIAKNSLETGSFESAIEILSMAIEQDPENVEAYRQRGILYMDHAHKFDLAIEDFNRALELEPQHVGTLINRGNAYDYSGEPDPAIEDYTAVLEINPDQAEAFHNRGLAFNTKGDYDRALQDFNKAIELNPDYKFAYNSRCLLFRNSGELDKALEDCNKAIEIDPDFAMVLTNRGYVYHLLGDHEKAIADLTRSIELNPHYGPTFTIRGFSYDAIGETQSAVSDFEQALAIGLDPEEQAYVEEILNNLTRDKIATPAPTAMQKIYSDVFSRPSVYLNPVEFDGGRTTFFEGGYRIEILKENWIFRDPVSSELSDVVVEVDVENLGLDNNFVGLMCRAVDGKNHYLLGISSLGFFKISKLIDNEWIELINWSKREAIKTGNSRNHIKVICSGNNLTLFVNDILLGSATDDEFSDGLVGIFADSNEIKPVDVLFDNFAVYQINP